MRGWVQKKSVTGVSGWRVWQSRLLEVRHDSLQYFSFTDAVVPRGVIPFEQIRSAVVCVGKSAGRFDVASTQRTFAFTCGQSDEAAQWVAAINAAHRAYIGSLTAAPAAGRGRVVQSRRLRRMSYVHAEMNFDFELERVYEPQRDTDTTALTDDDDINYTLDERDSPLSPSYAGDRRQTTATASPSPSALQTLFALAIIRAEEEANTSKRLVHSAPTSPISLPTPTVSLLSSVSVERVVPLSEERVLRVAPNNCVLLRLILRHMSALTVTANVPTTSRSSADRSHSRSVSAVKAYSQPNLIHRRMRHEKQIGLSALQQPRALATPQPQPQPVDLVPPFLATAVSQVTTPTPTDEITADTSEIVDDDESDVKAVVERIAPAALSDLITHSTAEFIRVLLEIFERTDNRRAHALAVRVLFLLHWQQRRFALAGHSHANTTIDPALIYFSACRGNISSTTYDSDVSTGDDDSGGDSGGGVKVAGGDGARNVVRIDSEIKFSASMPFRHSYSGPQPNTPRMQRAPIASADDNAAVSSSNDTFALAFAQFIALCCGGRKLHAIIRDALFACLLQSAADMADAVSTRPRYARSLSAPTLSALLEAAATAKEPSSNDSGADVFRVSMSMKVVHSEVWRALLSALSGSFISTRERTLADINSILIRQHDNVTSLQSIHRWSAHVYPLLQDIDRRLIRTDTEQNPAPPYHINATMDALIKTVTSCHALTINLLVVVLFDNLTALTPTPNYNPFLRALTAVMDELLSFAGKTDKSRSFALSLFAALLHKIQSARALFIRSPPSTSAAWLNMLPLTGFIKRFIFQTETWNEATANADSFNVLDAQTRSLRGNGAFKLSSALPEEPPVNVKPLTFDGVTAASTFGLHWSSSDDPPRLRDLPLIERLLNTLTAIDVAKFAVDSTGLAPADVEVVSALHSNAFLFFSDARVFLPAITSVRADAQSMTKLLALYFASKSTTERNALAVHMETQLRPADKDSAMFDATGNIQLSKNWANELQKITGL